MATSNPTMPSPKMPELGNGSWPNATAPRMTSGSWPNATAPRMTNDSWPNATAPRRTSGTWPSASAPRATGASWSNPSAPQVGYGAWPDLQASPPYSDAGPAVAAPMPQPVVKAARRGRAMVALSLSTLALGLAAGPLLTEHADRGLELGLQWLVKWTPNFLQPYLPKPLEASTPLLQGPEVAQAISAAPRDVPPVPIAAKQPDPTPEVVPQPVVAKAPEVVTAAKTIPAERRREPSRSRKARVTRGRTASLAMAESAAVTPAAKTTRRGRSEPIDPFAPDETGASKAAATARPAKVAAEPVASKSRPAKSGDTLEDLMAGAASASQAKDHRKSSRDIDAMLQDVQKSHPTPRPARAEPESLPSLTPSDIAKVMGGVKAGAKACGRRFGEKGVADLRLTVGKNGKVADVAVRGKLAGLSVAECISQVAREASFPPNSGLKFNYRLDVP